MDYIANLILAAVRISSPLIFLSLAELYSQRAGLVNIGIEGIAAIGSLTGFLVSVTTGSPLLGVLAGALAGILVNMIFAFATITLCSEQIVYGMAINIFAPALAAFIYRAYFGSGSALVQADLMATLESMLGIKSDHFLVDLFLDQTPMVCIAYALIIVTGIFFSRTRSGLNYKAVGEYPKAAATLGINVNKTRYLACVICGALAGMGGAYLTTCYSRTYVDGNVAGRGFIALATVIFGRWHAGGVLAACLFFGFCDALQIRLQLNSSTIPYQFFQMIPYAATIAVLAVIGVKKAGPKACGQPYRKEER